MIFIVIFAECSEYNKIACIRHCMSLDLLIAIMMIGIIRKADNGSYFVTINQFCEPSMNWCMTDVTYDCSLLSACIFSCAP